MDNLALLNQSSITEQKLEVLFQGHTNNGYENLTTKVVRRSDRKKEWEERERWGKKIIPCSTVMSALCHSVNFLLHSSLKAIK